MVQVLTLTLTLTLTLSTLTLNTLTLNTLTRNTFTLTLTLTRQVVQVCPAAPRRVGAATLVEPRRPAVRPEGLHLRDQLDGR